MRRIKRHLTYANVVSTLSLALALGLGGAYAVDRVGSPQIRNNSVRSIDLRDGKAVRGVDVKPNALGRKQVNEASLVATELVPVARGFETQCELQNEAAACVHASVRLPRRGRVLAITTGAFVTESEGAEGARAECHFVRNGQPVSGSIFFGEPSDNTDIQQGNGFAHTFLSSGPPLAAGPQEVAFSCKEVDGEVLLDDVSLVAVALTSR